MGPTPSTGLGVSRLKAQRVWSETRGPTPSHRVGAGRQRPLLFLPPLPRYPGLLKVDFYFLKTGLAGQSSSQRAAEGDVAIKLWALGRLKGSGSPVGGDLCRRSCAPSPQALRLPGPPIRTSDQTTSLAPRHVPSFPLPGRAELIPGALPHPLRPGPAAPRPAFARPLPPCGPPPGLFSRPPGSSGLPGLGSPSNSA